MFQAVGHPPVWSSRVAGLLPVAARAAPGSTGPAAKCVARDSAEGGVTQLPAAPPGAATTGVAEDFRSFRRWRGLPEKRGHL